MQDKILQFDNRLPQVLATKEADDNTIYLNFESDGKLLTRLKVRLLNVMLPPQIKIVIEDK